MSDRRLTAYPARRRFAAGACALLLAILTLPGCAQPEGSSSSAPSSTTKATGVATSAAVSTPSAAVTDTTGTDTAGKTAPVTTRKAATTTTSRVTTTPRSPRDTVKAKLTSGKMAVLYRTTLKSLFDRVGTNGYLQESVTGRYKGEYVRSIGAMVKLALEVGEPQAAGRALKFVTDTVQKNNLPYFPFTIAADQKTVRQEDELDGRAHLVLGWALYTLQNGPSAYEDATYARMAQELNAFFTPAYYYGASSTPGVQLMRNPRFTHTRDNTTEAYWSAFDQLTNHFVAAATEQMIAVAVRRGDSSSAAKWQSWLDALGAGIRKNLVRTVDGKGVYLDMLVPSSNTVRAETGLSWVCLSPVAAEWSGLDTAILANTQREMAKVLRRKSADGTWYIAVEASAAGKVKDWVLGKSVGWDIDAARLTGNYTRIAEWFAFLESNHAKDLYMETMRKKNGQWVLGDCGNAEQCIWFVWALARLRRELGLPVQP